MKVYNKCLIVLLAPILVTGCSLHTPQQLPVISPTALSSLAATSTIIPSMTPTEPSPETKTSVPVVPSPSTTTAITPTRTLAATLTSTPTPVQFSIQVLREPQAGDDRTVNTSFWSEDGLTVYYGLGGMGEGGEGKSPQWFPINVSTGHEIMLSASPPIIYTPIFLNHVYPDFQGFISPSGRYHLKIDTNYAGVYSETPVVSTLWLIDTTGAKPMVKVLDGADMFYRDAFWLPGEAKVVFGIGPEFGTELYLLDISSGKLNSISDLTGFNDTGLLEWCLSPDGEKIAVVDGQGNLQVISLDGASVINFPGFYQNLRWSHDSQMIYYYHGPDWYEVEDLGVYDLRSEKMPTLFTLSELHRHGIFGAFDVSPLGNKIVFWRGGEIRLIILSDCPGQMNGGGE